MQKGDSLVIRTDASSKIGIGHLMRCLALAQALARKGLNVIFISGKEDLSASHILLQYGFSPHLIENNIEQERDAELTCEIAARYQSRLIVIDHYKLQELFRTRVKSRGFYLLVIDDIADQDRITADLILNQNFGAESLLSRYKEITPLANDYLLGECYVMFREEILNQGKNIRISREHHLQQLIGNKRNPNILVTFGGSDPLGLTPQTISILKEIPSSLYHRILIVLGANAPIFTKEAAQKEIQDLPSAEVFINPKISELMGEADIAITAGGSTIYELAFLGVAPVIIRVAENQNRVCQNFARKGSAIVLFDPKDMKTLKKSILHLLSNVALISEYARTNMKLIDGKGVDRVVEHILNMV